MRKFLSDMIAAYIKRTSPHPGRGLLGQFARKLYPHDIVYQADQGIYINVNLGNPSELLYWSGNTNEHGEIELFCSFLAHGMTVVDIGANIGLYSLFAARAVGPQGRVYAFEPATSAFSRLNANIQLNKVSNIVTDPVAISDSTADATFFCNQSNSQGSLFQQRSAGTVSVRTESLPTALARHQVSHVDAIKIDVEGGEMHVLRGMRELLSGSRKPLLFIEINAPALAAAGTSDSALFETILSFDYSPFLINNRVLHPTSSLANHVYRSGYSNYLFVPRGFCDE